MGVNWNRVLGVLSGVLVTLCVVAAGSFYLSTLQAQALRFGQKLPSGPPRYYLREGSPQFICAPFGDKAHPSWSCAAQADVIALILKTPECGPEK